MTAQVLLLDNFFEKDPHFNAVESFYDSKSSSGRALKQWKVKAILASTFLWRPILGRVTHAVTPTPRQV